MQYQIQQVALSTSDIAFKTSVVYNKHSVQIKIAEIHFKDPQVDKYALQKVEKLAKFHRGIQQITVRLTSEKAHRGQNHTCFCELEFDISGKNFVIRDNERDIDKAIDKAVERAKRALVKHKEKHLSYKHKKGIVAKLLLRFSKT